MPTISNNKWWLHGVTLGVWALAAISAMFWGLKFVPAPKVPAAQPLPGASVAADPRAVARLLGAHSQGPAVAGSSESRYALLGVVADLEHHGAALIAVDGKLPKPFSVGAKVDDGLLLQSVAPRQAFLGPSLEAPASVTLDLPAPTDSSETTIPVAAAVPPGPAIPPERFLAPSPVGAAPSIRQRQLAPGAEIRRP